MTGMIYALTHYPQDRLELVPSCCSGSSSPAFGYEAEISLLDRAVKSACKGYIDGMKPESFAFLQDLWEMFSEMGGTLYVCSRLHIHLTLNRNTASPV
jgi:predicted peroxiredoxin